VLSEAPGSHVERAALHAVYGAARAVRDSGELSAALAAINEVAQGRDVPAERFSLIAAAALGISAARDRRDAARAKPRSVTRRPPRARHERRRMVVAA
jgi:hypothetical protein